MGEFLNTAARLLPAARVLWRSLRPAAALPMLSAREGYSRWAATYSAETAVSALDEELAQRMLRGLPHEQLLDAGCGTGRRIRGVKGATGMDLSPEMLAAGGAENVVVGDVRAIPFPSASFDMVWCRLVLGHLPSAEGAYRELARVCKPGGYVFVTDFHPDAAGAGHKRTGNDGHGQSFGIEHFLHTNHTALAAHAGLRCVAHRCGQVGPTVRDFYLRGLGAERYRRDLGLRLLDAYLFQKPRGLRVVERSELSDA